MERIGSDRIIDELQRRMAGVQRYQERMAEVEGVGEAAGGLVRVTVGPGGTVRDIELDPRAMRLPSQSLREALLEAVHNAEEDVREKTAALGEDLNRDTAQFVDAAGLRQEMDRLTAGFSRNLADVQQNFETLMRKLARER